MNSWDMMIALGSSLLILAAVMLIRSNEKQRWDLKNRAYFRKYIADQLKKYGNVILSVKGWDGNPVSFCNKILLTLRVQKYEKEISDAVTFLRNVAVIDKGKTTSTDAVLEMLAEHRGLLQPLYLQMLSLLRVNQKNEAIDSFCKNANSKVSRDFAWFLIQWDEIDPKDLSETLLSFERRLKEIRLTTQKRRDEVVSDLLYFPVVLNIFLIFINFIYVAYFLDQKEMMQLFMP